ncbi:MAG: YdeI/OmpD-associated family protein [Agriterribacter sp.]
MPVIDARIDTYIKKSAPFAQPVLQHLRALIHKADPDVVETIKWGFPNFESHGSVMCNMAAFKEHCVFGFWKASLLKDTDKILSLAERASMGHMGRISSLKDLPPDKILISYIKEAAKLNADGVKVVRKEKPKTSAPIETPDIVNKALKKNAKALKVFEAFPPSHRKEYIQWITEAKTDATRDKRIATMIDWLEEGKSRNWKYEKR